MWGSHYSLPTGVRPTWSPCDHILISPSGNVNASQVGPATHRCVVVVDNFWHHIMWSHHDHVVISPPPNSYLPNPLCFVKFITWGLLIMDHCVGKRGSLLAQIRALNWPSWELRCHAWALCHMWVFESLLLHFWASYWFPQTLAKSTESSSSISHPSPLALAIFWGFSLKVLHFSVFNTFSEFCR